MAHLLVPAKPVNLAKSRLASAMGVQARVDLYTNMLRHVVRTAKQCAAIDQVWVVSRCPDVAALAAAEQVTFISEPRLPGLVPGLQEVVDHGISTLQQLDHEDVLVVMGDLPDLTSQDLTGLTQCLRRFNTVVAPDRHGRGTNAIGFASKIQCATRFGRTDSFQAHLKHFEAENLSTETWRSPGVAFDIDTPEDLQLAQFDRQWTAIEPTLRQR